MGNLKGSRTERNMQAAFAAESMAGSRYAMYAGKARKEGYQQIAELFDVTSRNELAHGKIWFKLLNDGIGTTQENLMAARDGENYEWTEMYSEYAREAREEGFDQIADLFEKVAQIEKAHEARFAALLQNMQEGLVFSREGDAIWVCRNCGHIYIGRTAPDVCPVCEHPQGYFEIKAENY